MQLICTFAPPIDGDEPGQKVVVTVFDALVEGKNLVVGLTVGAIRGKTLEEVNVSPVGQRVLDYLGTYHDFRGAEGPVVIAGVASTSGATKRVREVLAKAPPGSAVALLCADNKVYDKAFEALNVNLEALNAKPQ